MKLFFLSFILSISALMAQSQGWQVIEKQHFTTFLRSHDTARAAAYIQLVSEGVNSVRQFFGSEFKAHFQIYVHPDRSSLDSTWQHDWKLPGFRSECWMVASGVAQRLDILSPVTWDTASCEHSYRNYSKTLQLIAHECVHVFHGQWNPSPDFSEVEGIDWFVEGLAVYASGQLDSARIAPVLAALRENMIPMQLDQFWSGKLKYGLSGSLVKFLAIRYGKETLFRLLQFKNRQEILAELNTSELILLESWKNWMLKGE